MDTPIRMPFLERRKDNLHIQKPVQPNGATAFAARSFVKLAAGILVPCVTADVVCYGWSPDGSHAATDQPPAALFGQNHWPFDPKDSQFVMNITDAAGHVGQANGAPQLSSAVVGTSYGLLRDANGFQMLNTADTTNLFAKVIALYPGQALTDYNGLVLVELLPAVIQA
jgi:hypothetical protein